MLFTSSSTVRNLVGIAGKPHARTVVAVIGPKTAETAAEFGLRVDVQPRPRLGARPGRGARRVRRRAAREAGRDAGQAAPRLEGPGPDRAAVPLDRRYRRRIAMSYPDVRPRRLRRTAAMRRLVEETRLSPGRAGAADVRQGGPDRAAADQLAARRGAALARVACARPPHEAVAAGVGGLMLFGVPAAPRTRPARPALDPDGILNVAIRDVIAEVGDATVVMSDLCLDEFTSHGHCGVLAADGSVDNDATLARYAEMARRAGRGRRPHGRPVRHDGRPGRRRPPGPRRGRPPRRVDPRLRRQVRVGASTARSARRSSRRWTATADRTSRTRPTSARRCARSTSTSPRAPTS